MNKVNKWRSGRKGKEEGWKQAGKGGLGWRYEDVYKCIFNAQRICIPGYTLSLRVFNLAKIDTLAGCMNQLLLLPGLSGWWPSRMLVS